MWTQRCALLCLFLFHIAEQAESHGRLASPFRHRRRAETQQSGENFAFSRRCYGARSAFTDPSCNCFGEEEPSGSYSKPTVAIVAGEWKAGTIDAFVLKTIIEEKIGHPTILVTDAAMNKSSAPSWWSEADIKDYNGADSVWPALEKGECTHARTHARTRRQAVSRTVGQTHACTQARACTRANSHIRMFMHTCTSSRACTLTHACTLHPRMHVCEHARVRVWTQACTNARARTRTRSHAQVFSRACAHAHVHVHAYTHARTHACTHVRTHIHMLLRSSIHYNIIRICLLHLACVRFGTYLS